MAATAGNMSYALTSTTPGWRKASLMEKIITISPVDYPVFTRTGSVKGRDRTHYWQKRSLPNRDFDGTNSGTNSTVQEGADFAYQLVSEPTRPSNTMHIFQHGVEVTGTAQEIAYHGITKLLSDQIGFRAEEHKGAMERALIKSVESAGATNGKRFMDGLLAAITTNASDAGQATLTEATYKKYLQAVWGTGARARWVLTNGSLRQVIDEFTGGTSQHYFTMDSARREVVSDVVFVRTPFGTVENLLSRDLEDGDGTAELVALDWRFFHKAWLRPTFRKRVETDGDYFRTAIVSELSLQYDDEAAALKDTGLGTYPYN